MKAGTSTRKRSLADRVRKSHLRKRFYAVCLVAPAVVLMGIIFVYPVGSLLPNSVDDTLVNKFLVRTFQVYDQWDQEELPGEYLYEAMFLDIKSADKLVRNQSSRRMVSEMPGWRALILKSSRKFRSVEEGPYKEAMIAIDKRWGDIRFWHSLGAMTEKYTLGNFLNAFDMKLDGKRNIVAKPAKRHIYQMLWWRTLKISLFVTFWCLLLGYPVAYLMANSSPSHRSFILICVLMPFTTSVLVRISAGMIVLQEQGVVNDILVGLGLLDDDNRLSMMYNFKGSVIVLTHTLLPFMILPLYSVMRRIPKEHMQAAQGLGASPPWAFLRVYLPMSMPGVSGGAILVFIMAFGNYITPEFVGGAEGRMIASMVTGWGGFSAAIGVIMLLVILAILWTYYRLTDATGLQIKPIQH